MSSGLPSAPREPRILPFRPPADATTHAEPSALASASQGRATSTATAMPPSAASSTLSTASAASAEAERDAARRYLKFMLPSIPITAFIATFVICYLARTDALDPARAADPMVPFLAALLLGTISGSLCILVYFGYVRISGGDVRSGGPDSGEAGSGQQS